MPEIIGSRFGRTERLHYTSTSVATNIIMGITSEKYEKGWMLTKAEKTAFLGSAGSIRAGGPSEEGQKTDRPTFENDLVPACWHSLPREFFEELIHSFGLKAVFVPTVMDDNAAMACIISGTPAVMMLFSEEQRTLLRERLLKLIWQEFRDPHSKLYEAGVSKVIGTPQGQAVVRKPTPKKAANKKGKKDEEPDDDDELDDESEPVVRSGRKAAPKRNKPKAKAAQSKKRKAKHMGDAAEEDDELDGEEDDSELDLSEG